LNKGFSKGLDVDVSSNDEGPEWIPKGGGCLGEEIFSPIT
jgi:hypothetical protein